MNLDHPYTRGIVRAGFTIVELLIAVAIVLLFAGGVVSGYRTFNDTQTIKQVEQTLVSDLRLAQARATSGEKPGGCTKLVGYTVRFSNTPSSYTVQPQCAPEGLISAAAQTVSLPTGVTFSNPPASPVIFGVLTQGVTNPTTVTVSGGSKTIAVTISASGTIDVVPTPTATITPTPTTAPPANCITGGGSCDSICTSQDLQCTNGYSNYLCSTQQRSCHFSSAYCQCAVVNSPPSGAGCVATSGGSCASVCSGLGLTCSGGYSNASCTNTYKTCDKSSSYCDCL